MESLATILALGQETLWSGFVVLVRVGAMMAIMPVFGEQSIPVRIRLAVSIAFCVIVTPVVADQIGPIPDDLLQAVPLLGPEVLAGLFFGLMLRFFVFALQIAGSIAAQSTSLSQIFGGSAGADPQPAIANVLVIAGLALAALMGLHVEYARYILSSYLIIPVGIAMQPDIVADLGVGAVSRVFRLGFVLAAPFVLASLIYNVTLGVINRAMPQLMVSFVGAPAITAGGLFLLLLTAPIMLSVWLDNFSDFLMNPSGGLR